MQANKKATTRLVGFDLCRIFACICVLIVHFNAALSGYNSGIFEYSNFIVPGFIFNSRVYLGTLGVEIFFFISGASLVLSNKNQNITLLFFKKRILSIFPAFWIAFSFTTLFDFLYYKGLSSGSPLHLLFSFCGLDGYLSSLNLIPFEFYKVGEWFLGCIIVIYLLFPALLKLLNHSTPLFTVISCLFLILGVVAEIMHWPYLSADTNLLISLSVFCLGMIYIKLGMQTRIKLVLISSAIIFAICLILQVPSICLTISLAIFLIAALMALSKLIHSGYWTKHITNISGQTFAIFLVHHWLIYKLIAGFNLAVMSRRTMLVLFVIYIGSSYILSLLLSYISSKLKQTISNNSVFYSILAIILAISICYSGVVVTKRIISNPQASTVVTIDGLDANIQQASIESSILTTRVENCGKETWAASQDIRCGVFINGIDSGIRGYLRPDQTVGIGESTVFEIPLIFENSNDKIEIQMLMQTVTYFGNKLQVSGY